MDSVADSPASPASGANPRPPSPNPVLIQGKSNRRDKCECRSQIERRRKGSEIGTPPAHLDRFQGSGRLLNRTQASVRAKGNFHLPRVPKLQYYNVIPRRLYINPAIQGKAAKGPRAPPLASPAGSPGASAEPGSPKAHGSSPSVHSPTKQSQHNLLSFSSIRSASSPIDPNVRPSAADEPNRSDLRSLPPLPEPVIHQGAANEPNHSDACPLPTLIDLRADQSAAGEPNQSDAGPLPPLSEPGARKSAADEPNHPDAWPSSSLLDLCTDQSAANEPNHSDAWSLLSLVDFDACQSAADEPNLPDAGSFPPLPEPIVRPSAAGEPNPSDDWAFLFDLCTGQSAADEPNQPDAGSLPPLSESVVLQRVVDESNPTDARAVPSLTNLHTVPRIAVEPDRLGGELPPSQTRKTPEGPKKRKTRRAGRRVQYRRLLVSYYTEAALPRTTFTSEIAKPRAPKPVVKDVPGRAPKSKRQPQRPLPRVVKVEATRGWRIARWKRPAKLTLAPVVYPRDILQIPGDPRYSVYTQRGVAN